MHYLIPLALVAGGGYLWWQQHKKNQAAAQQLGSMIPTSLATPPPGAGTQITPPKGSTFTLGQKAGAGEGSLGSTSSYASPALVSMAMAPSFRQVLGARDQLGAPQSGTPGPGVPSPQGGGTFGGSLGGTIGGGGFLDPDTGNVTQGAFDVYCPRGYTFDDYGRCVPIAGKHIPDDPMMRAYRNGQVELR